MKATCAKNAASIFASGDWRCATAVAKSVPSDSRTQGKDRHPDCLLVREVTEDCPLRDADPVGDGLRGDRIRPALAGQRKYRSDDLALSFVAAQTLARSLVDAALNIHDGGQLAFL
jgi:hypothetical protein